MGCGECMAKFGLITFNILFLLSGVAVLGVGIWVKVDKNVVNMQHLVEFDSDDKSLSNAAWVLIGFGSFVLLVSAFGFLAACCAEKTRFFIIGYIFFLVVIFCGEFGGGITAAVFKGKIDSKLQDTLTSSLKSYKPGNNLIAKAWDYVQTWLKCCGSNLGPKDYKNASFTDLWFAVSLTTFGGRGACYNSLSSMTLVQYSYAQGQHVPKTCCVLKNNDPENPTPENEAQCQIDALQCQSSNTCPSKNVKIEGCYKEFEKEIKSHLVLIIGVGVGIAMFQLLGIVMAICICKNKKDDGGGNYVY